MEFQASNSTEFFVERRWDGGRREGGQQRRRMLVSSKPTISSFNHLPISDCPWSDAFELETFSFNIIPSQMALGLMVGAAAFFAVGFFAAGTGKDLTDGPAAAEQGLAAEENAKKQDEEYDYSWAMQGVNRSRIR